MIDNIPKDVLKAATQICEIFFMYLEYPEDGWISLNDYYDLNMWTHRYDKDVYFMVGTIYYVENGETRTQKFIEIFRRLI